MRAGSIRPVTTLGRLLDRAGNRAAREMTVRRFRASSQNPAYRPARERFLFSPRLVKSLPIVSPGTESVKIRGKFAGLPF